MSAFVNVLANVLLTLTGIVVPSLLVAVAVRRWIVPVPWRIVLFFLALTLAFLHGAVFSSRLPVPVDEVARGYPFRGVTGEVRAARNPLTNDTVKLFLPWMQVAREELFHGRPPLWNRYSFSGYPLLGNGESAPFSPLFLATLFVPLPKQIVAMAGLKLFLALLFGYLFVKRESPPESGDSAACVAAAAFAFSIYQTTVLYYSAASVSALLPATFFAVLYAIDTARARGVVLVALVVATLLANGHPESVFHIAVGVVMLAAIELALAHDRRDWLRRFRFPLLGAVAGALISAPAWLPTLEMIPLSSRYAALRAASPPGPEPLVTLWMYVSPNGFGHPLRHNWNWIGNYTTTAAAYVGLTILALAGMALISRAVSLRQRLRIVLAVGLVLVAMRWTVLGRAVGAVPPFDLAANDKLRFVALFLAAAAAAQAIERISWRRYLAVALPLGALAVYVYAKHAALMKPIDLLPVVLMLALPAARLVRLPPAPIVLAATVVELFVLNAGFNALVPARYHRPELPIVRAIRAQAPAEPFRMAGLDWAFLPNASAQYGLEDIRGSDPMSFAPYTDWLRPLTARDPATDLDRLVVTDDDRLDFLGVRFLITEPGQRPEGAARWRHIYGGKDGELYENLQARPRFFAEGTKVVTRAEGPARYRVTVEAPAPAMIASSVPTLPGWRVWTGGRRVDPKPGPFLAFPTPAGRVDVEVEYRPRVWASSLLGAVVGLGLLAVVIFFTSSPKSWNRTPHPPVVPGP